MAFGCGDLYLERFLERPRHIEFQVLGDRFGSLAHLGERECTIQRRHQKLLEESPSPALSEAQRREVGRQVLRALSHLGYSSAGTVEFLMDEDGQLYFIEMNPRIQVEHPVTEMVTNIDLVKSQILIAAGEPLDLVTGGLVERRPRPSPGACFGVPHQRGTSANLCPLGWAHHHFPHPRGYWRPCGHGRLRRMCHPLPTTIL